ncbi:hypothetical protein D3C74_184320 [compost metagenome]
MGNQSINTYVLCGEKGVGKSTYVFDNWPLNIALQCDSPLNKLTTTSVLENALLQINSRSYSEISEMVQALRLTVLEGRAVVIDCAEFINIEMLEIVVNTLISIKSATLIFTFDIDVKSLYQNKIFRRLIEWSFVSSKDAQNNFRASTQIFEAVICNALPGISQSMIDELIEISYCNFNYLKGLIWLIQNKQSTYEKLSESILTEYTNVMIKEKFSDIPEDIFEVLKKSSVIGEIFQRHVLEAQGGFHISGVKLYLEELETMHLFIQSYLSPETYHFMSSQIHAGVLRCIESNQRIAWEKLLLNYYLKKLKSASNIEVLEILLQIKRLSESLNESQTTYFANKKLLYRYMELQDMGKAFPILDEIIHYCNQHMDDNGLFHFLCFYKIRLNMKIGEFLNVLSAVNDINKHLSYADSLYLQYYQALSFYSIGDVDQSYVQISDLTQKLARTSSNALENQPIYALSYSLMATVQHHFGMADGGRKYYVLALNHSNNKLQDKKFFYEISKKCDMYFTYSSSKKRFLESITFFEKNESYSDAAEVYVNLATEMMFHDKDSLGDALTLFQKAHEVFENTPNWKLAYVNNNLAIFHILYSGDFFKAASLLKTALLVDMSNFTYLTIYLNLCMCYLILYGPESNQLHTVNKSFNKYHKLISSRENATQYDDIYKQMTDLIILEHSGHEDEVSIMARSILAQRSSDFFTPILHDLIKRTDKNFDKTCTYSENVRFYTSLNQHRLFLAEFRFWE